MLKARNIYKVLLIPFLMLTTKLLLAQTFGGGADVFEDRVQGLTSSLIKTLLPAVSALGLIWAAVMAAVGNEGAKGRMTLIVIASLVGFLAPLIISWFKAAVGG